MIFKISIDIYKTHVWCYVGITDEEAIEHYRRRVGPKDSECLVLDNGVEARCIIHKNGSFFCRFQENPTVGTVTHELLHVVMETLRHRGLTPVWESEEAYTYLISYLITEFYRKSKINLYL
jgi:hypothetical protein